MTKASHSNFDNSLPGLTESFTDVFNNNYKRLCVYALQFLLDPNTCEDIVQNTFIKFWDKRFKIDLSNSEGLLYKMVREASYDYLRSKRKLAGMEVLGSVPDNSLTNEIIYAETFQELLKNIKELSPKCGAIVYQLFVQQKDNAEVAKEFNIKESTVRKQKEKAIAYFKYQFNKIAFILIFSLAIMNISSNQLIFTPL